MDTTETGRRTDAPLWQQQRTALPPGGRGHHSSKWGFNSKPSPFDESANFDNRSRQGTITVATAASPEPLLKRLLHYLTAKDEVENLLPDLGWSPQGFVSPCIAKLQYVVNGLAYHMSAYNLALCSKNTQEAMSEFSAQARSLSANERLELLTTATTTWNEPTLAPLLYYAVASGSTEIVHFLLDQGADPNLQQPPASSTATNRTVASRTSTPSWEHVPVLALAVARGDYQMVHLLLRRGANPLAIPTDMYLPSMKQEGLHALPLPDPAKEAAGTAWCQAEADRKLLQGQLDSADDAGLWMQYWLARALKLPSLTHSAQKLMSAAKLMRAPELRLAVPGQEIACTLLYNHVMQHGMDKTDGRGKPLVLALAGPSGHGKTMLGQMMQDIMPGAAYCLVDCSKVHHVVDLFGASGPFRNSETRPVLAQHLFAHSGKPSVVILDEFEKMRCGVDDTLLSVLEKGRYADTLTVSEVDCSSTIFLLTTNAADKQILDFWAKQSSSLLHVSMQPSSLQRKLRPLTTAIKAAIAARTSRSLTSRLSGVIPFVPFTETEQMIVVQQELLELQSDLAKPPNKATGRPHGNIELKLRDQPKVCRAFAKDFYNEAEGARAVRNEVKTAVGADIGAAWREEEIMNGGTAVLVAGEDQGSVFDLQYGY